MRLECKSSGVSMITLDRPPANAIGEGDIPLLSEHLANAASNASCRALIISGAGRFFCAGADVTIMEGHPEDRSRADRLAAFARALQELYDEIESFPVPVVAAIRGNAIGGGLELAMACDFRIVARDARVGLPETKLGLIPGAGGTQRMVELIGRAHALDLILRGRLITGEEAVRIGLATEAVDAEQVESRAAELAAELAGQHRGAMAAARKCIALARSAAGFAAEIDATRVLHGDPETVERIEAFLSRRTGKS